MVRVAEVVMFCYGFGDMPGAIKVLREDYKVARAETNRICAIRYRYFALKQKTGFFFCIFPVKLAWLAFPDWPGLAGFGFLVRGFFDNNIFNSRHFVSLLP